VTVLFDQVRIVGFSAQQGEKSFAGCLSGSRIVRDRPRGEKREVMTTKGERNDRATPPQ
jgi:hypothetical protein